MDSSKKTSQDFAGFVFNFFIKYWSRLREQKNIFFDMRRLVQRTYVETETNATYKIGPNTNRKNWCLAVVDPYGSTSLPR